jgi:hypothetical protein
VRDTEGVGVEIVAKAVGVLTAALDDCTCVDELLTVDGSGDAVGPLHPAAITQISSTAHTANVAVLFFIKRVPRQKQRVTLDAKRRQYT